MKSNVFGNFLRNGRLADQLAVTDDTTLSAVLMESYDGVCYQLISADQVDNVTIDVADHVVASSKTFTFANYTFTAKSGCTIRISGAANSGNNGDFVVSTVSSAHVVICTTASGLVNETFDPATVTVKVIRTDAPLQGDWTVEVSNTYSVGLVNDPATAGKWTDITGQFTPTIVAVTDVSDQFVQACPLMARAIRVGFTYTSGVGTISVFMFAKGSR